MNLAPKVLWPSNWLAVTQNKPSRFSVNPVLFNPYWLTMIDELYLHSYANEPNKSPWRERLWALLLWKIGHLSSPSRSCLGRLILHPWRTGVGGAALKLPDTSPTLPLHPTPEAIIFIKLRSTFLGVFKHFLKILFFITQKCNLLYIQFWL